MAGRGIRIRARASSDARIERLLGGDRLSLEQLIALPGVTIVKDYSKAIVLRIEAEGTAWYLKWYRLPSLRLRLKAALTSTPAARFRAGSEILAKAGFRGPRLVGTFELGSRLLPRASLVVTEAVAGAEPLATALAAAGLRRRRDWLHRLGGLFRDLHAAGVLHKDLKDSNILLSVADGEASFTLLDLEDVRQISQLGRERRFRSLMQLHRTLGRNAPLRERIAFLQGYVDGVAERDTEMRLALAQVGEMGVEKDLRDRGRVVRKIDHAGFRWLTTLSGARLTEQIMSWAPEAVAHTSGALEERAGRSRRFVRLRLADGSRYWVRFYRPRNLRKALFSHERRGRARREWDHACEAGRRGVPTVLPEARAHDHAWLFRTEIIAYPELEGARDLAAILADAELPVAEKRARLTQAARVLRRTHDRGVTVRHLRADQVLFTADGAVRLLGLERVRFGAPAGWRGRIHDLAAFDRGLAELRIRRGYAVPRTQRLRFIHAYLEAGPIDRAPRRVLERVARRSSRAFLRRERRRRRSLRTRGPRDYEMPSVSCFIICKDEEELIRDCLESVRWCKEIVVVDSFSTDRTVEICREYTDRVFQRAWPGFVEQKRYALGLTRNEWVLNLDADERITPALRREIERRLAAADDAVWGFYIPRLVFYLGRWWRHGWYPEYRLRLFRKSRVTWGGVDPHERAFLADERRAVRLKGDITHLTYRDLRDQLRTINRFTTIAAREAFDRGKHFRAVNLFGNPVVHFIKFYVIKRGFLDGIPGLFMAGLMALHVFLKYAKLRELEWSAADAGSSDPRRALEPSAGHA
ncbi:MAG: lipopolysaccharide kinase InaA family protein [bacterium]